MLRDFLSRYESFLLIDPNDRAGALIRARALYGFGWAFVFIQILNLVGMTFTYGDWTPDHAIAFAAASLVIGAIHCLRFYKNFTAYGVFFTALSVVGVLASAVPDNTGINSALLPILIMIPILNGFISGPRMALITGITAIMLIGFLYFCSAMHSVSNSPFYDARNIQRALQASFAAIMVTTISVVVSANIFRAFDLLEENVKRARKAETAKSDFLASMSHELRTPLNGVLGLTESLLRTDLNPEQKRLTTAVESSGNSLLMILNDILDLSKIEARKLETTPQVFDPRELTLEIADAWRETALAKGLQLHAHVCKSVPQSLIGDDLRIRQIISNLVSNAVKFTNEGFVEIQVDAIVQDDSTLLLQFAVRDTGNGVPKTALTKIFNPFEQAESGITRRYGGTGLGLAICRQLADLLGGAINLETAEGQGSTFYLTVPVEEAQMPHANQSQTPAPANVLSDLKTARVLLVEDNLINQMVAEQFLKSLEVEYETAVNGAECLNLLEEQEFHAIIMDKHMPVMDGVEATAAIRAMDEPLASIPIIACTADAMTGEKEALLEAGFTDFIAKPLRSEILSEALHRALMLEDNTAAA